MEVGAVGATAMQSPLCADRALVQPAGDDGRVDRRVVNHPARLLAVAAAVCVVIAVFGGFGAWAKGGGVGHAEAVEARDHCSLSRGPAGTVNVQSLWARQPACLDCKYL